MSKIRKCTGCKSSDGEILIMRVEVQPDNRIVCVDTCQICFLIFSNLQKNIAKKYKKKKEENNE